MMTFHDHKTYNWYSRSVQKTAIVVMDPSELPDRVEEVIFWWNWAPDALGQKEYYAIGTVMN